MKKILISFLIFISYSSFSQDFNNYIPVKASDKIPQDFISLSSDIYEKERQDISLKEKRFVKKAKDEFFLESSFGLHQMLYSGKIIFNDPLTKYVEKVANEVFKSESGLNQKIQVFVMKSSEVNAFATNNGMIFITMGLLAQLENEAQLAFILSHEFTHYKKKHVMTGYVETKKIKLGKTDYRNMSIDSKVKAKFKFSKDQETEADIDGLEMYLKTNYSLKVLSGVFDVLEYEYLPFDDIPFDKNFFNTKHLKIPNSYFLENVREISAPNEDDDADVKSTHPSIFKRRNYISDKIKNFDSKNRVNYIISEADFKNVRKVARYELSQLYLYDQHYLKAIYNSYLLLKENPTSIYLKKNIAKSMYTLAKYKNISKYDNLDYAPFDSIEGSSQNVYHLFEKLNSSELSTITIKYLSDLNKLYPQDIEIKYLKNDLIEDAIINDAIKKSDFSVTPKEIKVVELNKEKEIIDTTKVLSKYEKIKKSQKTQKVQQSIDSTLSFTFFALVDEMSDPEFLSLIDKAIDNKSKNDLSNLSYKEKNERRYLELKLNNANQSRIRKHGESLGIDKVVFINPHYRKLDFTIENKEQHLEGEEAQLVLNDEIKELAPKAGLQIEMIDDIGLTVADVDKFNDFGYLNLWFEERYTHIENDIKIVNLDKTNVDYLINKYKTKYFCWTGFIGEREKKQFKAGYILGSIFLYPLIPVFVYLGAKPEYQTYYYSIVYDIETGKAVYSKVLSMDFKDSDGLRRAHLYDMFYQMKQSKISK
jgi:hypothetical protein